MIEGFAFPQQQQRGLRHRSQVAAGADRAFLANDRCDAFVEHLHHGQRDLGSAAGIAMRMDVDAPCQRGADVLDGSRVADPGGVVVDQIFLEFLDLLIVEHLLGKLADAGVGAVHDLVGSQFLLQHGAADLDALQGGGGELHFFVDAGNGDEFFDGEGRTVEGDGHGDS